MWELGYITHRSAKWHVYRVGQFRGVYEHRIPTTKAQPTPRGSRWSHDASRKDGRGVLTARECCPSGRATTSAAPFLSRWEQCNAVTCKDD